LFSLPLCIGGLLAAGQLFAVDFAHQVMPVLKQYCADCHTGNKKKGGLAMNTRPVHRKKVCSSS
jgi:hypothetical protein